MKASALVTANGIVRRFGLSYQTLNYYTNLGLLHVAKRDGNGRLYDPEAVEQRLDTIGRLKDAGYPLRLISQALANGGHGAPPALPVAVPTKA